MIKTRYKIEAVIFDMDGVLIDSEPAYRVAEKDMMDTLGVPFGPEQIAALTGGSYRTLGDTLRGWKPGLTATDAEIQRMYVGGLLKALRSGVASLVDGIPQLMESLHERGVKMAIGSASHRDMVEHVVERFGLGRFLTAVVSGTDAALGKPAPDIFLLCAERMGVEPQKCLVIEDSINGLNAARGAGMSCAAFLGTAHHPFDMSAASVSLSSFGPDGRALIHQFIENGGEGSK